MNATPRRVSGKGFAHPQTAPTSASTPVKSTHYRLTADEWDAVWEQLKPSEVRILYYLRLLDPFGDRDLAIGVRELARKLAVDHATVSRALKTLDAKGYIDLELLQVKARIRSKGDVVPSDTTGASEHHRRSPRTTGDRHAPPQSESLELETLADTEPAEFSPEPDFVPEQTLKDSVNNRSGLSTGENLNKKEVGTTSVAQLIPERTGVPLNTALLAVVEEVAMRYPEESYSRVTNAITAYLEQKATVRNPQAFISAALRRGFTSNQAKRQKRTQTKKQERTTFPPAPARPQILDLSGLIADIQIHCQRLNLSIREALERFGRAGRSSLADLNDIDLATFRHELAGWT